MLDGSAPGLAHDARAVRIVDDDDRAVALGEPTIYGQFHKITFHRETPSVTMTIGKQRATP